MSDVMNESDRKAFAARLAEELLGEYGNNKKAAYTKAQVNAATFQRALDGLPLRSDRLAGVVRNLWPESDGDWRKIPERGVPAVKEVWSHSVANGPWSAEVDSAMADVDARFIDLESRVNDLEAKLAELIEEGGGGDADRPRGSAPTKPPESGPAHDDPDNVTNLEPLAANDTDEQQQEPGEGPDHET